MRGIVPPRTFDTISPRQCPTKNGLIPPSARSNKVGLNEISQPRRSLRGFRLDTASAPAHPRSDVAAWQHLAAHGNASVWARLVFTLCDYRTLAYIFQYLICCCEARLTLSQCGNLEEVSVGVTCLVKSVYISCCPAVQPRPPTPQGQIRRSVVMTIKKLVKYDVVLLAALIASRQRRALRYLQHITLFIVDVLCRFWQASTIIFVLLFAR